MSREPTKTCACNFVPITSANHRDFNRKQRELERHSDDHCCSGWCEKCFPQPAGVRP